MNARDAVALLHDAVPRVRATWADLGAGSGAFTRALAARLAPGSVIYAVDRDAGALAEIEPPRGTTVHSVAADFIEPFALPGREPGTLDGLLLANALHYVADPETVLTRLTAWLRAHGRVVLIEYDRRRANRWVPYPIAIARLPVLAAAAGLAPFAVTATQPSAYGGDLYVAAADRTS